MLAGISRLACVLLMLTSGYCDKLDGDEFCNSNFVENKFYYNDPEDCHFYYHCADDTHGWNRQCQNGTFWSGALLTCVPEGDTACTDRCVQLAANECYSLEDTCGTFFRCANTISYRFCCPAKTAFNDTTCACDYSETCEDVCLPEKPTPLFTTTPEPPVVDQESCVDSYGNTLRPYPGDQSKFKNGDYFFNCAVGTWFSLATCDCSIFASGDFGVGSDSQCSVYLPFDEDFNDYSFNKFETTVFGSPTINKTFQATGEGSAAFWNKDWVEIAGTKNLDFKNSASWCFFFNSSSNQGSYVTVEESTGYQLRFFPSENRFRATVRFSNPTNEVELWGDFRTGVIFQHVCLVADSGFFSLYMNNVLVDSKPFAGFVDMTYAPYRFGYDLVNGMVDEVLLCPFALDTQMVRAHFAGDMAYLETEGLIPRQPEAVPQQN